jgi:ATP-dependent helicase Lhr and Lhr-like helicase
MSLNKLHPRLRDHVTEKWKDLTPIQKQAFDPIYQGESCIIEAPTSGGKTEAVLFPLITRIASTKSSGFKVLYIAPLKALLNDLALRVIPYAKMCFKEAFKWHGDVSQAEKLQQMMFPSDILLTTPESIEAILLRKSNWVEVFRDLETIVIDEAHYFANTERGSHLISLLERVEAGIKRSPQRVAVSATIGNPADMVKWLLSSKQDGKIIRQQNREEKKKDFLISFIGAENSLHDRIYQLLLNKKSIVFARSRSFTEEAASKVNERSNGNIGAKALKVRTHHSSVSKGFREIAESSIKSTAEGAIDAIISTSTLELGIDIGDLDQVIQIGGLNSSGSFLQRVGRTGRRSGRSQYFRGLCCDPDELILLAGCVSLGLKNVSEAILFPHKAFHILAHQVICLCLENKGMHREQIWQILSGASCFSQINKNEFDILVNHMLQEDYLRLVGHDDLVTGSKTESDFLRANWRRLYAIFDTGPMYDVVDGKRIIGTLDSSFAREQELPLVFVLGGMEWFTLNIDHETQQVKVEENKTGIAPKWAGFGNFDIPFELAQEIGELLTGGLVPDFLDRSAQIELRRQQNIHCNLGWNRDAWVIDHSEVFSQLYLYNFAGNKINRVLARLFEAEFDNKPQYTHMGLTISIKEQQPLTVQAFQDFLKSLQLYSVSTLVKMLEQVTKVKWFSKFSECIPDELAKRTIFEKDLDLFGLLRELERVKIIS